VINFTQQREIEDLQKQEDRILSLHRKIEDLHTTEKDGGLSHNREREGLSHNRERDGGLSHSRERDGGLSHSRERDGGLSHSR
jgi:hypothetical protein